MLVTYNAIICSIIMFGSVCWGGNISKLDRGKLENIVKKAGQVVGKPLDSFKTLHEKRLYRKLLRSFGDRLMSSESLKCNRSKVLPVNEGDINKRPCIDTLHESFSSPGDSDTAYETTILEPDSESEVCRLHSTVLDPAGSDD